MKANILRHLYFCLAGVLCLCVPATAQVNTENLRNLELSDGFHNRVDFSFGLLAGNSDIVLLSGKYRIDYVRGEHYAFGVFNYQRGLQNNVTFVNKGFIHLRVIRKLNSRLRAEIFTQREFDEFILLDDRVLLGGGLRVLLASKQKPDRDDPSIRLYAGAGVMWENEKLDTDPPQETNICRSTNYLSFEWTIDERMHAGAVSYVQFDVTEPGDYRILLESEFGFDITETVAFDLSFRLRYDNRPPAAVKNYDLDLKNGLEISF